MLGTNRKAGQKCLKGTGSGEGPKSSKCVETRIRARERYEREVIKPKELPKRWSQV